MQLPIKAHYATLAMLALAERSESAEPVPARLIASEQRIPMQFLGQILQQLRAAGLIASTRGANGGFVLAKQPDQVSVAQVVDAVCPAAASTPITTDREVPHAAAVGEVWEQLQARQRALLSDVKLSDLLQRASVASPMFYI